MSAPQRATTEVVAAVADEASWPEAETLILPVIADESPGPEPETLILPVIADDSPGPEAEADGQAGLAAGGEEPAPAADAESGPTAGDRAPVPEADGDTVSADGDESYWREAYAQVTPAAIDQAYKLRAEFRARPTVGDEASGPDADTQVMPVIAQGSPIAEEPARPRRRRWVRRSRLRTDLMLPADITEMYSKLTGDITKPPDGAYRVQYRHLTSWGEWFQLMALLVATLLASAAFFLWLIQPGHYPNTQYLPIWVVIGSGVMYWTIIAVEGVRLLNSVTLCWAAGTMRDPVPVEAPSHYQVAFVTAFVPMYEPVSVLRETLMAAKRLRYAGPEVDVWVLDEGNDDQVRRLCERLGVRHFSRNGVAKWNIERGRHTARERFGAKTKHGNYNAWHDHLKEQGIHYDLVASCDMDHAPLPCFLERLLGYFRDPNVAYVVTPQVYANAVFNWIARSAEAMNHMFHSVVQPAGNRGRCAMFVGTNNIYRVAAWEGIGGFQPSITEDLATAYGVLGARNPATGKHWESVYARDVVAYGAGPDHWAAIFKQQGRWARGSNEIMVASAWKLLWRLPLRRKLHYITLMLHYPTVALTWLLGVLLTVLYMVLGTAGIYIHINQWAAFYIDVFTMRLVLYLCLRRFNISPHEAPGSFGISGIFMSVLCTPFYSTAFTSSFLRRTPRFEVTPKGRHGDPDRAWQSFRKHWFWAAVSAGAIGGAIYMHHTYPANMVWAILGLITSMLPFTIWSAGRVAKKFRFGSPGRPEIKQPSSAALNV
jgi:cellulose synthase/poly-beta-1,6-N-acetylglucosamine synthase-like glycosyltransferase